MYPTAPKGVTRLLQDRGRNRSMICYQCSMTLPLSEGGGQVKVLEKEILLIL